MHANHAGPDKSTTTHHEAPLCEDRKKYVRRQAFVTGATIKLAVAASSHARTGLVTT